MRPRGPNGGRNSRGRERERERDRVGAAVSQAPASVVLLPFLLPHTPSHSLYLSRYPPLPFELQRRAQLQPVPVKGVSELYKETQLLKHRLLDSYVAVDVSDILHLRQELCVERGRSELFFLSISPLSLSLASCPNQAHREGGPDPHNTGHILPGQCIDTLKRVLPPSRPSKAPTPPTPQSGRKLLLEKVTLRN